MNANLTASNTHHMNGNLDRSSSEKRVKEKEKTDGKPYPEVTTNSFHSKDRILSPKSQKKNPFCRRRKSSPKVSSKDI